MGCLSCKVSLTFVSVKYTLLFVKGGLRAGFRYSRQSPYNRTMPTIGYSGTPLAKKLGIKPPLTLLTINAPREYKLWLGDLPKDVKLVTRAHPPIEAAHLFVTDSIELDALLSTLRNELKQDGFVWVSWYKKSARIPTDITEDVIREIALPIGFVDVKVCAVSDVWSGLKLVIRKSERK